MEGTSDFSAFMFSPQKIPLICIPNSVNSVKNPPMPEPASFTFKIDSAQAAKLRAILEEKGFTFREVPYTLYGAQKQKLTINAYTSGKLLVQGRGAKEI